MKVWVNCSACHHNERLDIQTLDLEIECSRCKHSVTLPDETEIVQIETGYRKATPWNILTFFFLAASIILLLVWQVAWQENPWKGSDAETWMWSMVGAGTLSFAFGLVGIIKSREVWY